MEVARLFAVHECPAPHLVLTPQQHPSILTTPHHPYRGGGGDVLLDHLPTFPHLTSGGGEDPVSACSFNVDLERHGSALFSDPTPTLLQASFDVSSWPRAVWQLSAPIRPKLTCSAKAEQPRCKLPRFALTGMAEAGVPTHSIETTWLEAGYPQHASYSRIVRYEA